MSPSNFLDANQSSFEVGTLGFFAWNCTATRHYGISHHGNYSLKVSASLAQEALDCYVLIHPISLYVSSTYTWHAHAYLTESTGVQLHRYFLQENGGAFRGIAQPGTQTEVLSAGWNLIDGTGNTTSDWHTTSRIVLRPPRKADDSAYDSTKSIYYDALMVEEGNVVSEWVLGGNDYNALRLTPDAVLASSGFSNATTPNIAFIQDDPEDPDANTFS